MLSNRRSTMLGAGLGTRPTTYPPPGTQPPTLGSATPDREPRSATPSLLSSTTATLPGHRIARVLGAVYGATAYAVAKDVAKAHSKSVGVGAGAGGEVRALTHAVYAARDRALERMLRDAVARGANAVVAVAFQDAPVVAGCAQVLVLGTAVFVVREGEGEGEGLPGYE
ncbi:putative heavy-metal-binding-domain-containing protein [Xylariomycetidae sp. FL0641]|nr:putative heavy-metal-binding-domain-containing protein [Xylariomycetidae sp. FL0641]